MSHCYINNSGGDTFFEKFRNRFAALQCELQKLENVMNDSENLCSVYSFETVSMLKNVDTIHNDLLNLYNGIVQESINIDPIENKLLSIRERLIKFEENPELLKRGYVAYVPTQPEPEQEIPEPIIIDQNDDDESDMNNTMAQMQSAVTSNQDCDVQLTDIFTNNNQTQKNTLVEPMCNLAIGDTLTRSAIDQLDNRYMLDDSFESKKPVRKINPKLFPGLANAFSKIDRWRSMNEDEDHVLEPKPIEVATKKQPINQGISNGSKSRLYSPNKNSTDVHNNLKPKSAAKSGRFNELVSNNNNGTSVNSPVQQTEFIGTPNLRPRPVATNNPDNTNLFPSLKKKLIFSSAKKSVIASRTKFAFK